MVAAVDPGAGGATDEDDGDDDGIALDGALVVGEEATRGTPAGTDCAAVVAGTRGAVVDALAGEVTADVVAAGAAAAGVDGDRRPTCTTTSTLMATRIGIA